MTQTSTSSSLPTLLDEPESGAESADADESTILAFDEVLPDEPSSFTCAKPQRAVFMGISNHRTGTGKNALSDRSFMTGSDYRRGEAPM